MKPLIHAASTLLLCTLLAHGGYLGLGLKVVEDGALVRNLIDGGPAAKAGLQDGDLILKIDGKPASQPALPEIVNGISAAAAGTKLAVEYRRAGKGHETEITLGKRPAPPVPRIRPAEPDVEEVPANKWLRKKLPEFDLADWHQLPKGTTGIGSKDFDGKAVMLFFYTAGDPESPSQGMRYFKAMAQIVHGYDSVLPIAIHISGQGEAKKSADDAIKELRKHKLDFIPMAHVVPGADGTSAILELLDVRKLPYFMIIDREGTVRLADSETHTMLLLGSLQQLRVFRQKDDPPAEALPAKE